METVPANPDLFFHRDNRNDPRLGEIVPNISYESADVVILGCPQDEGVARNKGRIGAAKAPDAIRTQFYKLTNFGITKRIYDAGNTPIADTLEETHDNHTEIVKQILNDGKKVIVLGGGNDISYADGRAVAETFGPEKWLAVNIDAHFDVRADSPRNSGTPYRQLLDEGLLTPNHFYEVAWQPHLASPVYYKYLIDRKVNLISFEQVRSAAKADIELREKMRHQFIHRSSSMMTFFGFDLDAVRSSDAPGTSAPSPIGLRAGEFLTLVKFAASLSNTKVIEFTEVNPNFDIDNRTAKLVAIAMHTFCSLIQ